MAKVKWDLCCTLKARGGLGILNIRELADLLAAKWILKSTLYSNSKWAWLLRRNIHCFHIKGNHSWTALPLTTIIISKYDITAKGVELTISLWKAWFKIKHNLKLSPNAKDIVGSQCINSILWPTIEIPQVDNLDMDASWRMHKRSIKSWDNRWDNAKNSLYSKVDLIALYNLID